MAAVFDAKHFNEVAFGKYMDSIPDARRNKLLESGAIVRDKRLSDTFAGQTTTSYAEIPFYGNLEGAPDIYDGVIDTAECIIASLNTSLLSPHAF